MKSKLYIIVFSLLFVFPSCRKDIDVPEPVLENLFGEWNWVETSGGMDGGIYTPSSAGYSILVKFTDKGVHKSFKNKVQNGKARFNLTVGTTMFGNTTANLLNYYSRYGFLGSKEDTFKVQSIKFQGDTLVLIDESMDGYNHYYVKNE